MGRGKSTLARYDCENMCGDGGSGGDGREGIGDGGSGGDGRERGW